MWTIPPPNPTISAEEVHLWRVALDGSSATVRRLGGLLGPDEALRADRFRLATHRNRYIVGRGALRIILGRYLSSRPEAIGFRYGERGKPSLDIGDGGRRLHFNVAHSQGLAVVAIASGRLVGVDLERVRPMDDADRIVARFFSEGERSAYLGLTEDQRLEAFFRAWTRKEAYLKATGQGLGLPLDAFDVSLAPGEAPGLLRVAGDPDEPSRWALRDFSDDDGYRGALAVEGAGWRLSGFRFEPDGDSR